MTIKDIIEKLEGDIESIETSQIHTLSPHFHSICDAQIKLLEDLLDWIKSNLGEDQAKYGKDEDDYFESKIAEEREG